MNFNEKSLRKHKIIEFAIYSKTMKFFTFFENRNVHFYFDFWIQFHWNCRIAPKLFIFSVCECFRKPLSVFSDSECFDFLWHKNTFHSFSVISLIIHSSVCQWIRTNKQTKSIFLDQWFSDHFLCWIPCSQFQWMNKTDFTF